MSQVNACHFLEYFEIFLYSWIYWVIFGNFENSWRYLLILFNYLEILIIIWKYSGLLGMIPNYLQTSGISWKKIGVTWIYLKIFADI